MGSPTVLGKFDTQKFALLCTGCDSILIMKSKAIINVTASTEVCEKCSKRHKFEKLKLFFRLGSSDFPLWLGSEYLACVTPNCDTDLTGQFNLARNNSIINTAPRVVFGENSNNRFSRGSNQLNGNPEVVGNERDGGGVKCGCGKPAKRFQVKKDGKNKGKWFYSCDGKICSFFEWENENHNPSKTQT